MHKPPHPSPRKESVCIKAAYILPRFLSPTLTHWEELILPAGSSSLLLPASAESSGFKTHPDTHMHNRWAVPLLTAHEYKAGPAASSAEPGKISFSIHWPLFFFFFFFSSPSCNYFSTLGETLSIIVRWAEDKTAQWRISCCTRAAAHGSAYRTLPPFSFQKRFSKSANSVTRWSLKGLITCHDLLLFRNMRQAIGKDALWPCLC